jgi:hypothetical protein
MSECMRGREDPNSGPALNPTEALWVTSKTARRFLAAKINRCALKKTSATIARKTSRKRRLSTPPEGLANRVHRSSSADRYRHPLSIEHYVPRAGSIRIHDLAGLIVEHLMLATGIAVTQNGARRSVRRRNATASVRTLIGRS